MRRQVASVNLVIRADSSLDSPPQVQAKSEIGSSHGAKSLHHLVLAEVDVELVGSTDFRDNLNGSDQTLVSHLGTLLLERLVSLGVI